MSSLGDLTHGCDSTRPTRFCAGNLVTGTEKNEDLLVAKAMSYKKLEIPCHVLSHTDKSPCGERSKAEVEREAEAEGGRVRTAPWAPVPVLRGGQRTPVQAPCGPIRALSHSPHPVGLLRGSDGVRKPLGSPLSKVGLLVLVTAGKEYIALKSSEDLGFLLKKVDQKCSLKD